MMGLGWENSIVCLPCPLHLWTKFRYLSTLQMPLNNQPSPLSSHSHREWPSCYASPLLWLPSFAAAAYKRGDYVRAAEHARQRRGKGSGEAEGGRGQVRYRQQGTGRPGPTQVTLQRGNREGRQAGNIVRRSFAFDFFGRALNGRTDGAQPCHPEGAAEGANERRRAPPPIVLLSRAPAFSPPPAVEICFGGWVMSENVEIPLHLF